jgi:cell division protein FtsX
MKEEIKRHGMPAMIATFTSTMILLGMLYAVSSRYTKLDAGYEQNVKEHIEIKADTNLKFIELKKEITDMQKQNIEIIRALGRIEGKLER